MKKILTLIISLTFALACAAQTGVLQIHISSNSFLPSTVVVSRNDTIVKTERTDDNGYFELRFLPAGSYKVQVSQADYITSDLHDVIIKENAITELHVTLNHREKSIEHADEQAGKGPYGGLILSASIHPALDGTSVSDDFASSYRYGMGTTFFSRNTNFLHLAWTQVISAGGHRLNHSARLKTYGIEANEKYFYINYALAFSVRANIIRGNDPGNPKLFLETGGAYAFPFYYRHLTKEGGTSVHTGNIHKYTETHAFARLAFGKMSLRFKYDFTDYIKAGFPEPPRSEVALELLITD